MKENQTKKVTFLDNDGTFMLQKAENYSGLYFPVAGEKGIKSSISPNLGGDSKLNQNAFIMEPVSVENLHNNRSVRNFWCRTQNHGSWSVVGVSAEEEYRKFTDSQDESEVSAGFMWHCVTRRSEKYMLEAKIMSFVPIDHNVEIMQVEICNQSKEQQTITPIAAIPIFGRSADNIRDHRHVTSLLHRIHTEENGVLVKPVLSFDERGHKQNNLTYFVLAVTGDGEKPVDFYPSVEEFIGEGGSLTFPRAVIEGRNGIPAGQDEEGKEAMGGIRFAPVTLQPEEKKTYTLLLGATEKPEELREIISCYDSADKVTKALEKVKIYWQEKVNVRFHTKDKDFDNFLRWVSFQPMLRRIYGCSFLPHHDYGRGGRGWRDLWQDCLSLLIMDPADVRRMILDNYGGVRIDGTNATIIGEKQGEFIADRNNISRVWMDHGVWPFLTTKLYMDQTGDMEILLEEIPYFKDAQVERGSSLDTGWKENYGKNQKAVNGKVYNGTVLEHLLLQHLCSFYEVGEHNHIRLRGADWNDALDMAEERGESVAFTAAYAGNLKQLAECLRILQKKYSCQNVALLEEMRILLADDENLYEDVAAKQELLHNYLIVCRHNISGRKQQFEVSMLIDNLEHKAAWIMEHIRKTEWIEKDKGEGWFNSYYDNHGQAVEGYFESGVRMMLTGQVFTIMSGTAGKEQTAEICRSADRYLYDKKVGGYRLNTDFKELKFDLGRMFGFAYGEKENGAVFSHMTVMYANALYKNGFVEEGYKALQTLADTALDFETSKIYPGIPEYFNASGRGMYHYLTGAASWYMLTMVTEVFGVRGETGDLVLEPKLLNNQFDEEGRAAITLCFAGKTIKVIYNNPNKLSYGEYCIKEAVCNDTLKFDVTGNKAVVDRKNLEQLQEPMNIITVELIPV